MYALLKIEAVYDNVVQEMKYWTKLTNVLSPGLGDRTFGKPLSSCWVAKILGKDAHYKYKREFLQGRKDYTHSNRKGSRGIFMFYFLESKFVYEVKGFRRRYFCKADADGEIIIITQAEVDQWIADQDNPATTASTDWELPY